MFALSSDIDPFMRRVFGQTPRREIGNPWLKDTTLGN